MCLSLLTLSLSDDVYSDPRRRSRPKGGHFSPQGSIQASDLFSHIHPPDGLRRSVEYSQFNIDSQETLRHTAGAFWTAQRSSNKKREIPKRDMVERNKVTLGRGTSGGGSYVLLHSLQQHRLGTGREVCMTASWQQSKAVGQPAVAGAASRRCSNTGNDIARLTGWNAAAWQSPV